MGAPADLDREAVGLGDSVTHGSVLIVDDGGPAEVGLRGVDTVGGAIVVTVLSGDVLSGDVLSGATVVGSGVVVAGQACGTSVAVDMGGVDMGGVA